MKRKTYAVSLAIICGVGLWLRLRGLGYGLPAIYNMDEVAIMNRAMAFGTEKLPPLPLAATIEARPLRHACHAAQMRPSESAAATTSISVPVSLLRRTAFPGCPLAIGRAQMSKLPLSF